MGTRGLAHDARKAPNHGRARPEPEADERPLRVVLDASLDAVIRADPAGIIEDWNAEAASLFGWTREEAIGRPLLATILPHYRSPHEQALRRLVDTGYGEILGQRIRVHARHRSGRVLRIEIRVASASEHAEPHLWIFARELHLHHRRSPEGVPVIGGDGAGARAAHEGADAETFERLKAEFVRVAAHELNTPIAIVSGYVQSLALHAEALPLSAREMLEGIHRGTERMRRIVRDLLFVTRIELDRLDLARERFRLDELVRRAVARRARHDSLVKVRILRLDAATIEADREGIEHTVRNLLENAARYSAPGGEIDVELVVIGGESVLSVRDRGAGIPPEKQEHIFERFYRAHAGTRYDYEGLGIGLHISREIVTRQGGRMSFDSVEGQGSTFRVALPLAPRGNGNGAGEGPS